MLKLNILFLWDFCNLTAVKNDEEAEISFVLRKRGEFSFKCDACDFGAGRIFELENI